MLKNTSLVFADLQEIKQKKNSILCIYFWQKMAQITKMPEILVILFIQM